MSRAPILIVDDEPQNLAAMRQILEPEYPLVFARSGQDALVAVKKHQPALVLLDINMPDMDGYEVCRRLKADVTSAATPIIFVTALTHTGDEEAGFACGAVDYITKPVSPPIVRARVKAHLSLVRASDLEESRRDAVYMLGEASHYSDSDTGAHIWRMAAYAAALARARGWDEEAVGQMKLAAPMHDTGKIGIPSVILRKPGKLDPDEWAIMKTHTSIGHDILSKSKAPLFQLAAEIALNHHEWWDGTGYPRGLRGKEIPEAARIVAVADVFDALTMKRPYKDAWSDDAAVEELRREAGNHLDPDIVARFEAILPEIIAIKDTWNPR